MLSHSYFDQPERPVQPSMRENSGNRSINSSSTTAFFAPRFDWPSSAGTQGFGRLESAGGMRPGTRGGGGGGGGGTNVPTYVGRVRGGFVDRGGNNSLTQDRLASRQGDDAFQRHPRDGTQLLQRSWNSTGDIALQAHDKLRLIHSLEMKNLLDEQTVSLVKTLILEENIEVFRVLNNYLCHVTNETELAVQL